MAKNDAILLDGIIEEIAAQELLNKGTAFELLAIQQILKSYDLTREELDSGWVDGANDGGIDGLYIFLNGNLINDNDIPYIPKSNASFEIWIISCKHCDTFQQNALNTVYPSIEELLDFSKEESNLTGSYCDEIKEIRKRLITAYRKTASYLPSFKVNFVYSCRGDTSDIADNVRARGDQIGRLIAHYFSASASNVIYCGATELIEKFRKNRVILNLAYTDYLLSSDNGYVLLSSLKSYAKFITDESGNLRRYVFDSNVRDFLGTNRVNKDIEETLNNTTSPNFWWLNNGVTLLATSATRLGKIDKEEVIQLTDVQIVNGLQTSQTLFYHLKNEKELSPDSQVLVKVIVSEDEAVRDKIIEATNNQSPIELASLKATDKLQKDIEQILATKNWYYDRRKNFYKNIGKPADRFVEPLLLAKAVVAIILKSPQTSIQLHSTFMADAAQYSAIFNENFPIEIWPKLAEIIKAVDKGIAASLPHVNEGESKTLTRWRGTVALCGIASLLGSFDYDIKKIITLSSSKITGDHFSKIFIELRELADPHFKLKRIASRMQNGTPRTEYVCKLFSEKNEISGIQVVGKWGLRNTSRNKPRNQANKVIPLNEDVIELVKDLLPQQPWPIGTHFHISEKAGLDKKYVQSAIQELIRRGVFQNQTDGVVYSPENIITAIDTTRVKTGVKVGDLYRTQHNQS